MYDEWEASTWEVKFNSGTTEWRQLVMFWQAQDQLNIIGRLVRHPPTEGELTAGVIRFLRPPYSISGSLPETRVFSSSKRKKKG